MDFSKRSYTLELLDADDIPKEDLYQNLRELKFINTYLGGHDVIKAGLRKFPKAKSVLEIGSGGGDNLGALAKKFSTINKFYGVDLKNDCTEFAATHNKDQRIEFLTKDYRDVKSQFEPDVIFNSLFCHHFKDEELVEMFKWMHKTAKQGFFIGDLHRHSLAHFLIKYLTKFFSKSYLVKNDAPLSVRRGFTRSELEILLQKAGIVNYRIQWKWAFRWLVVVG